MRFAPKHRDPSQFIGWRSCALFAASLALAGAPLSATVAHAQGASPSADPKTQATESNPAADRKDSSAAKTVTKKPRRKRSGSDTSQSIVALVNDEPITGYEVQQRRRLMAIGKNINPQVQAAFQRLIKDPKTTERLKAILNEIVKANPGKSREEIIKIFEGRKKAYGIKLQKQAVAMARKSSLPSRKAALNELVNERLQLQEAKRLNAIASEAEVDRVIAGMAKRNKVTIEQFNKNFAKMGASVDALKERLKATVSWNNVIRRRFGYEIQTATRGLDRMLSNAGVAKGVELRIHRILLAMPTEVDQKQMAVKLRDAELMRAKFKDCKGTSSLATGIAGVRFQDLGPRAPSTIPEPTRTLLLSAGDNEMLPPSIGESAVELWAVCGRKEVPAQQKKRDSAMDELKQKEYEIRAKRHLKDLRQDAHIEYR